MYYKILTFLSKTTKTMNYIKYKIADKSVLEKFANFYKIVCSNDDRYPQTLKFYASILSFKEA